MAIHALSISTPTLECGANDNRPPSKDVDDWHGLIRQMTAISEPLGVWIWQARLEGRTFRETLRVLEMGATLALGRS